MKKDSNNIHFLGYTITDSSKFGYQLSGPIGVIGDIWKSDLGRYSTIDRAKKAALLYFMVENVRYFHAVLSARITMGTDYIGEWDVLVSTAKKLGVDVPDELTCSNNGSYIRYKKKPYKTYLLT